MYDEHDADRAVRQLSTVDFGCAAHADADELIALATAIPTPRTTYLVHGEPDGSAALAARLRAQHDWNAVVPRDGERVLV